MYFRFLNLVIVLSSCGAAVARAQIEPTHSSSKAGETDAADQDAESSFNRASAAAERGDIVGAISALERVLQTNPDLANIKLELGLLYLRSGNPNLAQSYLQQALNAPEIPEAARQRAFDALSSINGQVGGWTFSGSAFSSASVQTNPNGSPGSVSISGPGGTPIILSADDLSIPRGTDFSLSAGGTVQVRRELNSQRGNEIALDFGVSQTNYGSTTELDATFVSLRAGPRFFSGPVYARRGFVRPFVSVDGLMLGHSRYFTSIGGGADVLFRPSPNADITGQIAFEHRNFDPSRRRPAAGEQTGKYFSGGIDLSQQISPRVRLQVGPLFEGVDAKRRYWSRTTWGGRFAIAYSFSPVRADRSWSARLSGTYRRSDYSAPDPLVNRFRARDEDRGDVEGALIIPLGNSFSLDLRAGQTWNRANLPNYKFKNTSGSVGLLYRF